MAERRRTLVLRSRPGAETILRRLVLVVGAAVAFVAFAAAGALAETNIAACYGDTLDVSIVTRVTKDNAVLERKTIALLSPYAWLKDIGGSVLLNNLPCQTEPVEALGVIGGQIDARVALAETGVPGVESFGVAFLRLSTAKTSGVEQTERFWRELIITEGVMTPHGFVRLAGSNSKPLEGA